MRQVSTGIHRHSPFESDILFAVYPKWVMETYGRTGPDGIVWSRMTPYAVQMTATDLMNGSAHRNVRQRLLLFYHIYGRKPEKITIHIQKNHTIEIQKNHLYMKLKRQHRYTYQKQKIPIAWRPSLWYSKGVSENVPFSISAVHRQFAAVSEKATKENREQESDAFWGDRGRNFFAFSGVKTREFRKIPVDI